MLEDLVLVIFCGCNPRKTSMAAYSDYLGFNFVYFSFEFSTIYFSCYLILIPSFHYISFTNIVNSIITNDYQLSPGTFTNIVNV